jgi:C-terminal processing protease CtpA/Prc
MDGNQVGLPVAAHLTWEGKLIEGKGVSPSANAEMKREQLLAERKLPAAKSNWKSCVGCDE